MGDGSAAFEDWGTSRATARNKDVRQRISMLPHRLYHQSAPVKKACRTNGNRLRGLYIESELNHVAILHRVLLALDPELAGFAGFYKRAQGHQILIRSDFGGNKAPFEI